MKNPSRGSSSNKSEKSSKSTSIPYRCSLIHIRRIIEETMTIQKLELFKTTPFYAIVSTFYNRQITHSSKKTNSVVLSVLSCYNFDISKFKFGNSHFSITSNDFRLLFGIDQVASVPIQIDSFSVDSHLRSKYFPTIKRLRSGHLLEKLPTVSDTNDYVRLMCILILSQVFVPDCCWIKWEWLDFLSPFNCIKQYDWCNYFCSFLYHQLNLHRHQLTKVQGCLIALLYWICELFTPVEAVGQCSIPRFARWNLSDLSFALLNDPDLLSNINTSEIPSQLHPTDEELSLFYQTIGEEFLLEGVPESKDSSINNLAIVPYVYEFNDNEVCNQDEEYEADCDEEAVDLGDFDDSTVKQKIEEVSLKKMKSHPKMKNFRTSQYEKEADTENSSASILSSKRSSAKIEEKSIRRSSRLQKLSCKGRYVDQSRLKKKGKKGGSEEHAILITSSTETD